MAWNLPPWLGILCHFGARYHGLGHFWCWSMVGAAAPQKTSARWAWGAGVPKWLQDLLFELKSFISPDSFHWFHWFSDSVIRSFFRSSVHPYIDTSMHPSSHLFIHSFVHACIRAFAHPSIPSSIHACIPSFVRSFTPFIHSLISFIHSFHFIAFPASDSLRCCPLADARGAEGDGRGSASTSGDGDAGSGMKPTTVGYGYVNCAHIRRVWFQSFPTYVLKLLLLAL